MLFSDDSDFISLHGVNRFEQYNFKKIRKTKVHACRSLKINEDIVITPREFVLAKILNGDKKDFVPNFLNKDDIWLNDNTKYVRFGGKKALKIINQDEDTLMKYGGIDKIINSKYFKRNEKMLNLKSIPTHVVENILNEYLKYEIKGNLPGIKNYIETNVNTGNQFLLNNYMDFAFNSNPNAKKLIRKNPFIKE